MGFLFRRRPPGVPSAAPGPGLPGVHGQDGPDASLVLGGLPAPGARLPGLPALGAAHQPGVAGSRGGRRGLRGAACRRLLRQDALARLVVHHGRPEVRKLSSLELRHSRRQIGERKSVVLLLVGGLGGDCFEITQDHQGVHQGSVFYFIGQKGCINRKLKP